MNETIPLREFLAAHAPPRPADWFVTQFQKAYSKTDPMPIAPAGAECCQSCKDDEGPCEETLECLALHEHRTQLKAWQDRKDRALHAMWAWAWADSLIEFRTSAGQLSTTPANVSEIPVHTSTVDGETTETEPAVRWNVHPALIEEVRQILVKAGLL